MRSPYPELLLINVFCIENALKGTEIVVVLTRFLYNRVRNNEVILRSTCPLNQSLKVDLLLMISDQFY